MDVAQHLDRAKEFLAIAGAVDPKRDAYIKAATELALFRDTSPKQWRQAAASYCNTSASQCELQLAPVTHLPR